MKNTVKITPMGAVAFANGEAAERGVASYALNLREREDAMESVGECLSIGALLNDERLVLADDDGQGLRLLTHVQGKIVWHSHIVDGVASSVGKTVAEVSGNVTGARCCGNYAVIATDEEILVLQRTADGYKRLDTGEIKPLVMFSAEEQSQVSHELSEYTFNSPYTSWTALSEIDRPGISKMLNSALQAMCSSASFDGRYCGCLAARIGVRLYDDSYIWMSAPQTVGADFIELAMAWSRVDLSSGSSGITNTQPATVSIATYRLAVTVVNVFSEEWDGIVKSVDLLVTPQQMPFDVSGNAQTRCVTSTASGSREQYLLIAPATRTRMAIAEALVNATRWQVVSSTSNFAALRQGKWIANNCAEALTPSIPGLVTYALQASAASGSTVSQSKCADILALAGTRLACRSLCTNASRIACADITLRHGMPWNIAEYFAAPYRNVACVAMAKVTLSTADGCKTISAWANLPFTPTALSPIVTFPDSRATHITLRLQADGNVLQWQSQLMPDNFGSQASAVNPKLGNNTFADTGETMITLPETQFFTETLTGYLALSSNGNPLVWHLNKTLPGTRIAAIASWVSPTYHSGLGRYPLFLFCSDGIYALPLLSSGNYGEARMLSRHTIASGCQPCETSAGVYFANKQGDIMSIANGILRRNLRNIGARQIAWNEAEHELWLMKPDGNIVVMMPSGRTYCRSLTATWLYSQANASFAAANNTLLDITRESDLKPMQVHWLTQPIVLTPSANGMLRNVVWNIFTNSCDLQLQVNGERGTSCHGFMLSRINLAGSVNAPVCQRIAAPRLRTIRLSLSGTIDAHQLILPTYIK
ncbi:MAG: hypothetical protein ACI4AH_01650 [Muribaculaceae bacterium]